MSLLLVQQNGTLSVQFMEIFCYEYAPGLGLARAGLL